MTIESESCSLWSRDDASSERVRFDENVSFIDDLPSDEVRYNTCSEVSVATITSELPSDSWTSCRGNSLRSMRDGGFKNHEPLRFSSSSARTGWQSSETIGHSGRTDSDDFPEEFQNAKRRTSASNC